MVLLNRVLHATSVLPPLHPFPYKLVSQPVTKSSFSPSVSRRPSRFARGVTDLLHGGTKGQNKARKPGQGWKATAPGLLCGLRYSGAQG